MPRRSAISTPADTAEPAHEASSSPPCPILLVQRPPVHLATLSATDGMTACWRVRREKCLVASIQERADDRRPGAARKCARSKRPSPPTMSIRRRDLVRAKLASGRRARPVCVHGALRPTERWTVLRRRQKAVVGSCSWNTTLPRARNIQVPGQPGIQAGLMEHPREPRLLRPQGGPGISRRAGRPSAQSAGRRAARRAAREVGAGQAPRVMRPQGCSGCHRLCQSATGSAAWMMVSGSRAGAEMAVVLKVR